jgi:hypothetical protein
MRFVRELRARGYNDLARDYLQKLAKTAPPELKRELPLEIARTNMDAAAEEPDSGKRLALYAQARADFQKFLADNPMSPRAPEARLAIAQATTLQGKTQLSKALLQEDVHARVADGLKARAVLVDAANQLKQLPSTPQTELALGLNLFDQAQTFLNTGKDQELIDRGKKVQEAQKVLDKLAQGDPKEAVTWQARAWAGRCFHELGEPKKARARYNEIMDATGPAAREGKRLARYFRLLAIKESPETTDQPVDRTIIDATDRWIRDYPSYAHTPEGYGVRYLLAETLLNQAENPKTPKDQRDKDVVRARRYLREVEQTENDFTDRAKRLKLVAMFKQKAFSRPVKELKSFEDCFVRAQWEIMQIAEDAKKEKDREKLQAERKARVQTIIEALQLGLKQKDAKGSTVELNNARAMLAFYLMNEGRYKEAIETGEGFARADPRSAQAAMAAVYALLSYGQMIAQRERNADDAKKLQNDPEHQADKEKMLALAQYMEERWPKELAGDLARHEIAQQLLREENYPAAIRKLEAVTPTYPSYARVLLDLARACLQQAEQDKTGGYRQRALAALAKVPEPPSAAEPAANRDYVQARATLGWELYKDKKYAEVDALVAGLQQKLPSLKLADEADKDAPLRQKFTDNVALLSLYSAANQADADFKAGRHDKVVARLDPLVDRFSADKLPQMRENVQLGMFMLGMSLKSNVQLGKLDRTKVVLKALQALQAEKGGEAGSSAILGQLAGLISHQVEELRKKGDKEALKKAVAGFSGILDELVKTQKKPTPRFAYQLARCYAGMDEHKKAADLLKAAAAQAASAPAGSPEAQQHHAIEILLIQELILAKETAKAKTALEEIIGTRQKPGWGARNVDAQKLRVRLLMEEGNYGSAAVLCNTLLKQLLPKIKENDMKEQYLELYYYLVLCLYKNAQGLSGADKDKGIKEAARKVVNLEKAQNGFGSDESRKRFEELLQKEADLREQYNVMREKEKGTP